MYKKNFGLAVIKENVADITPPLGDFDMCPLISAEIVTVCCISGHANVHHVHFQSNNGHCSNLQYRAILPDIGLSQVKVLDGPNSPS